VENIVVLDPDFHHQYLFADEALRLVKSPVRLHLPKSNRDLLLPMDEIFAKLASRFIRN